MPLQDIIISKIDNFCGKTTFISTLKDMKYSCNKREKNVLDYTIMYYTLLFNITIDHEMDIEKHHQFRKELLVILDKRSKESKKQQELFLLFFIDLIHFGDDYINGLKRLIS
jgi:hypothetical protein